MKLGFNVMEDESAKQHQNICMMQKDNLHGVKDNLSVVELSSVTK